ncbi:MAG: hypothetical protein C4532_10515 [Candidatus Abyssobacteria bacterium SURF_17]|uniref:Uncharacterized protein n=1 Tax=Candidatus Abyssobacteria bacterium SURF_17 TaxID=2093361 RepID=A0A419EXU6_9BACT|nr:MAG: hypothetical protein C4532_10515 [Candidatus Abyssubacteria bacterium SURF_17]
MSDNKESSKFLQQTLECSNCGGTDTLVIEEDIIAPGDKVYPTGSVLCAKCRTPTMVKVYRWTKWKETP